MIAPGSAFARINDIAVQLSVELGGTRMSLREVLALDEDDVVMLDRLIDEPVDLLVNGHPIAKGEVVAENNRFGLRIIEVLGDNAAIAPPCSKDAA